MRGRGLLIAAAVLQLVGAAIFLLIGGTMLAESSTTPHGRALAVAGALGSAVALGYVAVSLGLLGVRRWAWIASLALDGLSALSFLSLPILGRVGVGELLILLPLVGVPLFVTLGLLIGGRRAAFAPTAKTAAVPMRAISRDA